MIQRTRSLALRSLLVPSVLCLAAPAKAQVQNATGFSLNRFDPADVGSDWFAAESLDLRGKSRFAAGLVLDYARKPLVAYDSNGDEVAAVVANQLFGHVGGNIVLGNRIRLGLSLPVQLFQDGTGARVGNEFVQSDSKFTVGDLRIGADLRIAGQYDGVATLAVGLRGYAPTGSRDSFTGDGSFRGLGRLMFAGHAGMLQYAASAGFHLRTQGDAVAGTDIGSEIPLTAAVGGRFMDGALVVGPEVMTSTSIKSGDVFGRTTTPAELILGGHWKPAKAFQIGAGVSPGLSPAYGTPQFRALLSLAYVQPFEEAPPPPPKDTDGDGILDRDDACPTVPGVATDDPKTNGCPPPPDRDKDGILDSEDACPDVAGVKTDDPKTNGCPPPKDTDGDTIMDPDDACPEIPGIKTDNPMTNGCPDPDRDKDGINNEEDACPDTAGPPNKDPKKNGCPKAHVEKGQILILEQVQFAYNSDKILKESDDILNAVKKILTDYPQIKKISVEGHTDNKGKPGYNKNLSTRRAASVVKWLIKAGIDKKRMTSAGFGQEKPLTSNDTDEGRALNRRVEFRITEQTGELGDAPPAEEPKSKAEGTQETKATAKPDAKAGAKSDVKAGTKGDAKPAAQGETKAEATPDAKATEPSPEDKATTGTKLKAAPKKKAPATTEPKK